MSSLKIGIISMTMQSLIMIAVIMVQLIRNKRGEQPLKMLFRFYNSRQIKAAKYNSKYLYRISHNRLQSVFYIGLLLLLLLVISDAW